MHRLEQDGADRVDDALQRAALGSLVRGPGEEPIGLPRVVGVRGTEGRVEGRRQLPERRLGAGGEERGVPLGAQVRGDRAAHAAGGADDKDATHAAVDAPPRGASRPGSVGALGCLGRVLEAQPPEERILGAVLPLGGAHALAKTLAGEGHRLEEP